MSDIKQPTQTEMRESIAKALGWHYDSDLRMWFNAEGHSFCKLPDWGTRWGATAQLIPQVHALLPRGLDYIQGIGVEGYACAFVDKDNNVYVGRMAFPVPDLPKHQLILCYIALVHGGIVTEPLRWREFEL